MSRKRLKARKSQKSSDVARVTQRRSGRFDPDDYKAIEISDEDILEEIELAPR